MADRLNYFIVGTVINYFQAVKFEKPAGFHCLYSTPFLFPCPCWHILLPVMFSLECQRNTLELSQQIGPEITYSRKTSHHHLLTT